MLVNYGVDLCFVVCLVLYKGPMLLCVNSPTIDIDSSTSLVSHNKTIHFIRLFYSRFLATVYVNNLVMTFKI